MNYKKNNHGYLFGFTFLVWQSFFKKIQLDKRKIAYFLFYLGFVLAIGQELQQISLIYTDVANTGVFTVFYVLVVPVISYFIFSKKMHWSIWPSVFICILGGLLLSELNNYSVRLGDTLGILSAFCWGVHILLIRKTVEFFNLNKLDPEPNITLLLFLILFLISLFLVFTNLILNRKELF